MLSPSKNKCILEPDINVVVTQLFIKCILGVEINVVSQE